MNPVTMHADTPERTQKATRKGAEVSPKLRDRARLAAGWGWSVVPGKRQNVAKVLGVNPSNVSRRADGQHNSALSRACEAAVLAAQEGTTLEEAGMVSAFIDATLKAVTMWPALDRLTTPELAKLLEETYERETQIGGELDVMQMRRACGQRVNVAEERRLWTEQATVSERAMAILDLLHERPDYVG